jgi:hypothetical protein
MNWKAHKRLSAHIWIRKMKPTTSFHCWLVLGALIAVATASLTVSAQVRAKLPRPGLGNEIEGAVWQFTATRKVKNKEEELTGKFRVDGKAMYSAPMKRLGAEREKRIGDIITEKDESQLVFNDFDLLDGRAHVKKEKEQKNDLWIGYFVDKDKNRWKFELRKIDD